MKFGTPEFLVLQREWYQKLEQSGFEDIEDTRSYDSKLLSWHSTHFLRRHSEVGFECSTAYYRLALGLLNTHKFDDEDGYKIWELHAEGISIDDITERLGIKRSKVRSIVFKLRRIILKKDG